MLLSNGVADLIEGGGFGGDELGIVEVVVYFDGERETLYLGKDLHYC